MAIVRVRPSTVVLLPADPTGPHLADVVHELSRSLRDGDVVVDMSAVTRRSPGLALALRRLRRQAGVLGSSWSETTTGIV